MITEWDEFKMKGEVAAKNIFPCKQTRTKSMWLLIVLKWRGEYLSSSWKCHLFQNQLHADGIISKHLIGHCTTPACNTSKPNDHLWFLQCFRYLLLSNWLNLPNLTDLWWNARSLKRPFRFLDQMNLVCMAYIICTYYCFKLSIAKWRNRKWQSCVEKSQKWLLVIWPVQNRVGEKIEKWNDSSTVDATDW